LAKKAQLEKLAQERYDLSLPGKWRPLGKLHPLTQVRLEIEEIFLRLGFDVASGPEIETEYYNFEALNIGPDHPARDEWDSFYLGEGVLLRTHTSPVQIRVMKERKPPVRIICPGRCFRRDNPDATHSPVFHQVELLWVEKGLTFAHLKWVIAEFVREFFGQGYEMRFSADYFPFTEPSAQVHIRKKGTERWLEIMGAGMVHPRVLEEVGYDPEEVSGFAFGLGDRAHGHAALRNRGYPPLLAERPTVPFPILGRDFLPMAAPLGEEDSLEHGLSPHSINKTRLGIPSL
jgi:phenylalanyl-tRNA synthetase alpha chain